MKYRPGRPVKRKPSTEAVQGIAGIVIAHLNHEISLLKAQVQELEEKLSRAENKVVKYEYVRDQYSKLKLEKRKNSLQNNTT